MSDKKKDTFMAMYEADLNDLVNHGLKRSEAELFVILRAVASDIQHLIDTGAPIPKKAGNAIINCVEHATVLAFIDHKAKDVLFEEIPVDMPATSEVLH